MRLFRFFPYPQSIDLNQFPTFGMSSSHSLCPTHFQDTRFAPSFWWLRWLDVRQNWPTFHSSFYIVVPLCCSARVCRRCDDEDHDGRFCPTLGSLCKLRNIGSKVHLAHGCFARDWGHPKDKENIVQIAKTVGIYLSSCFWTSIQSIMTCHQFQDAKDIHLPLQCFRFFGVVSSPSLRWVCLW